MKRFLVTIGVLFVALSVTAQLYVFSLNGRVQVQHADMWHDVYVAERLQEDDLLTTEEYGNIVILDRNKNKKYSIQSHHPQTIQSLISSQGANAPTLPKEYIQRLYVHLLGYDTEGSDEGQGSQGIRYRSESIDLSIAHALVQKSTTKKVDFLLLDQYTLEPVRQVEEGQRVIFQIENHTNLPLYTTIIDRDSKGEDCVLLPVSKIDSLSDVYLPPQATIRLATLPVSFAPAGTSDELTLIAHSDPFNASEVLRMVQTEMANPATHDISLEEPVDMGYVSMKYIDIINQP